MQKVEGSNPFSRFNAIPLQIGTSPFTGIARNQSNRPLFRALFLARVPEFGPI